MNDHSDPVSAEGGAQPQGESGVMGTEGKVNPLKLPVPVMVSCRSKLTVHCFTMPFMYYSTMGRTLIKFSDSLHCSCCLDLCCFCQ